MVDCVGIVGGVGDYLNTTLEAVRHSASLLVEETAHSTTYQTNHMVYGGDAVNITRAFRGILRNYLPQSI